MQASFAQQQPVSEQQQLQPRQSAFAAQQAQGLEADVSQDSSSLRSPTGPVAAAVLGGQSLLSPMSDGPAADQQQRTASAQLPSPRFQGFGPLPQQAPQGIHGVPSSPLPQSSRYDSQLHPSIITFDHLALRSCPGHEPMMSGDLHNEGLEKGLNFS